MKPMFVCVIGMGLSGIASLKWLYKQGYHCIAYDDRLEHLQQDVVLAHSEKQVYLIEDLDLNQCRQIIYSPGVPLTHPVLQKAKSFNCELIGEIELAARAIQKPCIGITGTNGKTTVTSLIAHVFQYANLKAKAVGNIGKPFTEAILEDEFDYYIVELSSYQLEALQTPFLDYGIILNITPDHLDRYQDFQAYSQAKFRMQSLIKLSGKCIVSTQVKQDFPHLLSQKDLILFGPGGDYVLQDETIYYRRKRLYLEEGIETFNPIFLENILAAWAVCEQWGISREVFAQAIRSYKKPSHRMEHVYDIQGITFINDSKSTNLMSVAKAVEALKGDVYLICGGVDKGFDYSKWIPYFTRNIKGIFAIGEAQDTIKNALKDAFKVHLCDTLEVATKRAYHIAKTGDTVLLSPGCSSFDQFKNFEHRGESFKTLVFDLQKEEEGVFL